MVSFFNDLFDLMDNLEGTPWAFIIPCVAVAALGYSFIRWVIIPSWRGIVRFLSWRKKKRFSVHESLRYMQSADVYYALDHYIPTRYSTKDPARNEEPVPEYIGEEGRREPLLLDHFLKYEFDQRHGGKYYLVLGDCGMGKTTFLINLFYAASRKRKHPCAFVSLVNSDWLEQIKRIPDQEKTILLLDALDESDAAMRDFGKFMDDLDGEIRDFYRVVITSRTNFFTNAEKESLFRGKSSASTTEKISSARKYYIAPFTDEDIQHYLHQRYHWRKKYRQAWELVEANKNLSVRPLMLRYMDDMIREGIHFSHDFELYEYLFRRWIARESDKPAVAQQALYEECLTLAKAMYYQWLKDGRVGIYPTEIDEAKAIPGLSSIRFRGHAILNRTADGMYKFSHRSYWEYLVALLALKDLPFTDDLFIRNFEQAEAFLKEIIAFVDTGESEAASFRNPTARLGTANYYLKNWRPEEAERIFLEVLDGNAELTEEQDLFARIHLIRAYRYLWKEASAEKMLLSLHERLEKTELTVELVPQFTQFGVELGVYSSRRHLRIGSAFLKNVIEFCKAHPMPGYDLLMCFECLCDCVLNYVEKETTLTLMWEAMRTNGLLSRGGSGIHDEYADYLYSLARIWHTSYGDPQALDLQKRMLGSYTKFMGPYMFIFHNGAVAASVMAVYYNKLEYDGVYPQDEAIDYLADAYDLCCTIYGDEDVKEPHNSYMALLVNYIAIYGSKNNNSPADKWQETNLRLLAFRQYAHLEGEMQITYCKILKRAGNNTSADFIQRESYLLELLNLARTIRCRAEEIDALWYIFALYSNTKEAPCDGQEQLRAAYDLACTDPDYKETPDYCELLRVMIDFYKGEIDNGTLYRELWNITPRIYGNDVRRARIYRCLGEYAFKSSDSQAVDFALECLRCEFDQLELRKVYDACLKFADEDRFLTELETILREMPDITEKIENNVKEFLRLHEQSEDSDRRQFAKKVQETLRRVKQEKERFLMAWGRVRERATLQ